MEKSKNKLSKNREYRSSEFRVINEDADKRIIEGY